MTTDDMWINGPVVAGQGDLISEVFEEIMGRGCGGGNMCTTITLSISKMDAFNLLYRDGIQLEGCNGGANNDRAVFQEYIFARKNKL